MATAHQHHGVRATRELRVPIGREWLHGALEVPIEPRGLVVFAHGSGSSRHSPRNRYVAEVLQQEGLATLLVDLLTPKEEESDTKAQKISYNIPGLVLNKFNIN